MPGSSTSSKVRPATGRLGIITPGLGAVATTFIAGVESVRRGLSKPVGSLTQMATIRLGKRGENRTPLIKDFVPLADLKDIVFGAWDPIPDDAYTAASKAGVLEKHDLEPIADFLKTIKPMPAVFENKYVTRIKGTNVKTGKTKRDLAEQLRQDIRDFKAKNKLDRVVIVWCASTEIYIKPGPQHATLAQFEKAMEANDEAIAPSMLYAYAAIMEGVAFCNGAPNLAVDIPALIQLANEKGVAISGKDFKTGQTWMKTVIAPGLKARMLGLAGWYSTNILGNRDGEVLDDPASFKTKEESKLSVLHTILQPEKYPELYKGFSHVVRINYYPPRGDNKEGWDNIDIFGWMGYPMQIKVNFLCRDSILAAPIVLDLALFSDLAQRAGMKGVQEWLSFYYKSPMSTQPTLSPEHDLFIQQTKLKNTIRELMGEEPVTHVDDQA
ncbi:MAG: inositol-3-phosphate synthase [Gemmatimonadaceae bacterium]|nr:inositol-3-phosphate synthase [Gemmatimonadaceae bacterium]NUQ92388.1 inositol-3-phosphate synthase [Gemmatimonadaceae bacterium]NUR19315.1 inositol-3-phosphate synthase [Gemmatimonadaceae bacterium]NUS98177.1 inositol-3-phosphate synthase [Gemmatimonadaceae bacterium]